jgi:hypothetical protein
LLLSDALLNAMPTSVAEMMRPASVPSPMELRGGV